MLRYRHDVRDELFQALGVSRDEMAPMDRTQKVTISLLWLTIGLVSFAASALILRVMWKWFLVKGFGLQPISAPLALALVLMKSFFIAPPTPHIDTDKLSFAEAQKLAFFAAVNLAQKLVGYFVIAYLIHQIV